MSRLTPVPQQYSADIVFTRMWPICVDLFRRRGVFSPGTMMDLARYCAIISDDHRLGRRRYSRRGTSADAVLASVIEQMVQQPPCSSDALPQQPRWKEV